MIEQYFAERGIAFRTNDFQEGRETLVFVHGVSGSLSAWELYEAYFKDAYNVLTYDIRGHGKSYKPSAYGAYALSEFTQDLEALLAHVGIAQCVLISHSFGSLIALAYLHEHPERVRRAVLLSPSAAPNANIMSRILYPFILIATLLLRPFPRFRTTGWRVDYAEYPDTTDWDIPVMWANIRNTTLRVYLFCTLQSYAFNAVPYLGELAMPLLLMHGARDTIFPVRNAHFVHEHTKNSKLIVLPDIDHILVLNRFPEVSRAIEAFVKEP